MDDIKELMPDEDGISEVTTDVFAMIEEHHDKEKKKKEKPPVEKILTHEEFCEQQIAKARAEGLEDPDFDFRNFYNKDDVVFFVRVNRQKWYGKMLRKLTLRTIYPRMIVGVEDKGECCCIGYPEKDQIFKISYEAQAYYDSIDLKDEDAMKPKKKSSEEEEDIDEQTEIQEGNGDSDGD